MNILGLSGSPSTPSKTSAAIEIALESASAYDADVDAEIVEIGEYDVAFCDGSDPATYEGDSRLLIDKIVACDGLIVGSPMYRGSYTGILKNMFDLIPNDALYTTPVGLVATGGSDHHFLAIEHALKPLLSFFDAHVVPGSVYASADHYEGKVLVDYELIRRLGSLGEAVVAVAARRY